MFKYIKWIIKNWDEAGVEVREMWKPAQHRVQLTAFSVGTMAGIVICLVLWLVFVR